VGDAADAGPDVFADAPAVPSTVCRVDRIPLPGIAANSDLAIAPRGSGLVAMWADASTPGAVTGAVIDAQHQLVMTQVVPGLTTDVVGGVADAGASFVVATSAGTGTRVWTVPHDLSGASMIFDNPSSATGRDPFPSDNGSMRVYVDTNGASLEMYNMLTDGSIALGSTYGTTGPITELAGTDGPGHAHVVWTETIGAAAQCSAADIRWQSPTVPAITGTALLSNDCHELRNDSGPLPPDGMMIVWTSTPHAVEGLYIVSSGNVPGEISSLGRAPRTRYDGTRQWVSWIDETAGDELRFAIFDLTTGGLTTTRLPGWHPAGDEAYELVLSGSDTIMAVLSTDSLSLLTLCP
jgi:hypothetical protein